MTATAGSTLFALASNIGAARFTFRPLRSPAVGRPWRVDLGITRRWRTDYRNASAKSIDENRGAIEQNLTVNVIGDTQGISYRPSVSGGHLESCRRVSANAASARQVRVECAASLRASAPL
jgi:hypothetical protein